jgi:hypothetical protein
MTAKRARANERKREKEWEEGRGKKQSEGLLTFSLKLKLGENLARENNIISHQTDTAECIATGGGCSRAKDRQRGEEPFEVTTERKGGEEREITKLRSHTDKKRDDEWSSQSETDWERRAKAYSWQVD